MPAAVAVERVQSLGRERFLAEYLNRRPVVVTRGFASWPAARWTPDALAQRCGRVRVTARRYSSESPYSFLQQTFFETEEVSVAEWVDYISGRTRDLLPGEPADWSLRESSEIFARCPELLRDIDFAALFGAFAYEHYLWFGPPGYVTGLHADLIEVNLLAHVWGNKQVTLYSPADNAKMYSETPVPVEDGLYSAVDAHFPDLEKHPLFAEATPHRIDLGPGDLLFIPRGWWHMVRSLDVSLSITGACKAI